MLQIRRYQPLDRRGEYVPNHHRTRRRRQGVRLRVVCTENDVARVADVPSKGLTQISETGVDVEVIRLEIRDDRNGRCKREEGAVVFVRLDDERVSPPGA